MDIRNLILKTLHEKGEVGSAEIVKITGFSRGYVNRFFQRLRDEGKIVLIGKANNAKYVPATEQAVTKAKKKKLNITSLINNQKPVEEDAVLKDIKKQTGIFLDMPENVSGILSYAFLEMLNNAIEHSISKKIKTTVDRGQDTVSFEVTDTGIGLFNNIIRKKNLNGEMEAIQDLLKGKQTTAPESHSGEGIFFTSKAADIFIIQSSHKKLIFDNLLEDIVVKDIKERIGTKVVFSISLNTKRHLDEIFRQYTDSSFEFSKTKVTVRLYQLGVEYVSRSQARRLVTGLDAFKTIILDFKGIKTVGQAFADEIFRVWQSSHLDIKICVENANENTLFMIKRAQCSKTGVHMKDTEE
ncbi:MAG: DUF4325 domain-containing protein [Candidatus Ancaeobacter aquaticus]|nr:DUF4325 domain-containing protein [Candidatus Ancaeobacter aquaticus]